MNEELALIFSQFWLLGISATAVNSSPCHRQGFAHVLWQIISQSVSHILAVFFMRVLSTGWSAYTVWRTEDLRIRLNRLVVNADTPCHTDLFPDYFSTRLSFQVCLYNTIQQFFRPECTFRYPISS